jgi:hypothetical protein
MTTNLLPGQPHRNDAGMDFVIKGFPEMIDNINSGKQELKLSCKLEHVIEVKETTRLICEIISQGQFMPSLLEMDVPTLNRRGINMQASTLLTMFQFNNGEEPLNPLHYYEVESNCYIIDITRVDLEETFTQCNWEIPDWNSLAATDENRLINLKCWYMAL